MPPSNVQRLIPRSELSGLALLACAILFNAYYAAPELRINRVPLNDVRPRSVHGRFAVYESSPEGYFGVVDLAGHYVGPSSTNYEPNAAWLQSSLQPWGMVISLDPRAEAGPAIHRGEALPNPSAELMALRGRV